MARRLQLVETKARYNAAQKGVRIAHRIPVGVKPAKEGFLNYVLRIRD